MLFDFVATGYGQSINQQGEAMSSVNSPFKFPLVYWIWHWPFLLLVSKLKSRKVVELADRGGVVQPMRKRSLQSEIFFKAVPLKKFPKTRLPEPVKSRLQNPCPSASHSRHRCDRPDVQLPKKFLKRTILFFCEKAATVVLVNPATICRFWLLP